MFLTLFLMSSYAWTGTGVSDQGWQISDDRSSPITANHLAVSESIVFILDQGYGTIRAYDDQGQLINTFGGRGEAPGSFQNANSVQVVDQHLFVTEGAYNGAFVHRFKLDGTFVDKTKIGGDFFFPKIHRANKGWVVVDMSSTAEPTEDGRIIFYRHDGTGYTGQELTKAHRTRVGWPDTNCEAAVNPAEQTKFTHMGPDGNTVYYLRHDRLEVYNLTTGKQQAVIKLKLPRVPFNETWGNLQLQEYRTMMQGCKVTANFPQAFPPTSSYTIAPDQTLVVQGWAHDPDKQKAPVFFFNLQGATIKPKHDQALYVHWLAVRGDWLFLTYRDAEETVFLVKCKKDQAKGFLKNAVGP